MYKIQKALAILRTEKQIAVFLYLDGMHITEMKNTTMVKVAFDDRLI
jgi:hypothetical protein